MKLTKTQIKELKKMCKCSWCEKDVVMKTDIDWGLFANLMIKGGEITKAILLCPTCAGKFAVAINKIRYEIGKGKGRGV